MSPRGKLKVLVVGIAALAVAGVANAANHAVFGQTEVIKDPGQGAPGTEAKRSIVNLFKTAKGTGPGIVGNPVAVGATMSVITAAGSQCYTFPQAGWSGSVAKGFKYKGKLVPGNPAVSGVVKQSGSGVFLLKTVLKAKFGPMNDLLQANTADVLFRFVGGDSYCAHFGGTVSKNDQKLFKAVKASAGCSNVSACPGVCGDGILNPGETCDTGGVDTATCNGGLCTAPVCGDGYANAAAGEACDTAGNSATCDSDCTLPVCGDGLTNLAAGEACDTSGVDTAGCDAGDCSLPSCGDGYFNAAAGEACDSGGVDTAGCNGGTCTLPVCGDGHVNIPAGEVCDPNGSSFGSGPPLDNGICDGCLSPSGAFLSWTF